MSNGQATLTTSTLPIGIGSLSASYGGDAIRQHHLGPSRPRRPNGPGKEVPSP